MSLENLIKEEGERRTRPVRFIENGAVIIGGVAVPVAAGLLLADGLLSPLAAGLVAGGSMTAAAVAKYVGWDYRQAYKAGSAQALKESRSHRLVSLVPPNK